ncbi:hypothetical protein BpHYR1_039472, partial [Brachionus plicatilis]
SKSRLSKSYFDLLRLFYKSAQKITPVTDLINVSWSQKFVLFNVNQSFRHGHKPELNVEELLAQKIEKKLDDYLFEMKSLIKKKLNFNYLKICSGYQGCSQEISSKKKEIIYNCNTLSTPAPYSGLCSYSFLIFNKRHAIKLVIAVKILTYTR